MIFDVQYWFLNSKEIEEINNYRKSEIGKDEVSLLNIYSLFGNLLPIIIAIGMSIILMSSKEYSEVNILLIIKLINNGSLPLICYSIILSGLIFLLDKTNPEHGQLRKKVLGIGILLLFLSISLYTLLTSLSKSIGNGGHFFLLLISIFLIYNAVKITYTMVLLQNKVVQDYAKMMKTTRANIHGTPNNTEEQQIRF